MIYGSVLLKSDQPFPTIALNVCLEIIQYEYIHTRFAFENPIQSWFFLYVLSTNCNIFVANFNWRDHPTPSLFKFSGLTSIWSCVSARLIYTRTVLLWRMSPILPASEHLCFDKRLDLQLSQLYVPPPYTRKAGIWATIKECKGPTFKRCPHY